MDACQREIGLKTKDIHINTNCYFENKNGNTYVNSQASLDLNAVSLT